MRQPSSSAKVARLGGAVACRSRATASTSRMTRSVLPRTSCATSASDHDALQQRRDEPGVAADVLEPDGEGVGAVVVAADPDVVDACDLAHVLDVRDDLLDRRVGLGVLLLPRRGEDAERLPVLGVDARPRRLPRRPRPATPPSRGRRTPARRSPCRRRRSPAAPRARRRARCEACRTARARSSG